jgi:hypothetical protein
MKFIFSLFLISLTSLSFAQNFNFSGKIVDENGQPLESATIYVQKVADSSLVTYAISERNGDFRLVGNTNESRINLFISYAGYQTFTRTLDVELQIDLGSLKMVLEDNTLGEIVLTGTRPPITVKQDTLEFNAASFTTRPDANLEELLKKLPGVEVDSEGNITVNGKPVSKFLVNGEDFFGTDARIATKNLPKEIIDRIQVTDTRTRAQEFTGEPGDPENKTINITIKKDRNTGYFARATAGGGTDERYELSGIGNYFRDDMRVSVLASSNNINSSGFSYDEVYGMMGRTAGRNVFGGGGGGITKSETAGFNYVNKWNDLKGSVDYFFGKNDTERRTTVARENILPNSRYFTNSEDASNLINDSHRANARFEYELDSLTRISVSPRFNANYGTSYRSRIAESIDEDGSLRNNTETLQNEQLNRESFNNDIDFIKRFGRRGAFLRMEFSHDHNRQDNENFYFSESRFFRDGAEESRIQDQFIDEEENEDQYSFEISQRSVLADKFFLDLSYDLDYSNSRNKRYVFDADDNGDTYTSLNELLSNDFEFSSLRHTPNLGLNYEGNAWRVNTDVGLINTRLQNENFFSDTSFDNTYNNLFVRARVRYEIERSKSLSLRYNTNADIPSIRQLQPVVDRTNPLNIVIGNPELRPAYRQSIGFEFRNFDFTTRSGIFSSIDYNFTENSVVPVTTIDEDLVRTTTYTNVDGAKSVSGRIFYNKQIKKDAFEFRYRTGINAGYSNNVGFTNAVLYNAERISLSPSIRLTYAIEEVLDINPNYQLNYTSTTYDINTNRDAEVIDHRVGLEATTYWPKNVIFGNDISYNYFGNVSPGFDNSAILWNMSLGYQFLKERATLKVNIYDLLDQNVDTRRIIGDDFVQDTRSLILTRYAMLSFTYKLSNFGGQEMPGGDRRRGRR